MKRKHIVNPVKNMGVQKKQYKNGYTLFTYKIRGDVRYSLVTVFTIVNYDRVTTLLIDVKITHNSERVPKEWDFKNI